MLREKPEFYKEEIRCGYTVDEKRSVYGRYSWKC